MFAYGLVIALLGCGVIQRVCETILTVDDSALRAGAGALLAFSLGLCIRPSFRRVVQNIEHRVSGENRSLVGTTIWLMLASSTAFIPLGIRFTEHVRQLLMDRFMWYGPHEVLLDVLLSGIASWPLFLSAMVWTAAQTSSPTSNDEPAKSPRALLGGLATGFALTLLVLQYSARPGLSASLAGIPLLFIAWLQSNVAAGNPGHSSDTEPATQPTQSDRLNRRMRQSWHFLLLGLSLAWAAMLSSGSTVRLCGFGLAVCASGAALLGANRMTGVLARWTATTACQIFAVACTGLVIHFASEHWFWQCARLAALAIATLMLIVSHANSLSTLFERRPETTNVSARSIAQFLLLISTGLVIASATSLGRQPLPAAIGAAGLIVMSIWIQRNQRGASFLPLLILIHPDRWLGFVRTLVGRARTR